MFNYDAIDKTPTVLQVRAIIEYMEKDPNVNYDFTHMMGMRRPEPNLIMLDLNNAHFGKTYEIVFEENKIVDFNETSFWIS